MRVSVQITNISGERYWAHETPLPTQVQIAVNINIVNLEPKSEFLAEAPFVFTLAYSPSIAQLSVKGKAQVAGDRTELTRMVDDNKKNRPPPASVIQAISNIAIAEVIVLSKSLGIPPPLPPIGVPPEATAQAAPKKVPGYTT